MDFFINKNSTLPILYMDIVQDGRHQMYEIYELLQNSDITFSMYDSVSGVMVIGKKKATLVPKESGCGYEEYYVSYQFSERETKKPGTYIGKFEIIFLDGSGTLIVPIRDLLKIQILDSEIKK